MELAPKTALPVAIALLCASISVVALGTGFAINKEAIQVNTAFYQDGVEDINSPVRGKSYPLIAADNQKIKVGEECDPLEWVTATDAQDGDISEKVKVYGVLNNTEKGDYDLRFVVENSLGLKTVKKIRVIVD